MKKLIYLFVFISFLLRNTCMGDVIVIDVHKVDKCVKITNMDDFPDISLLGYPHPGAMNYDTYLITSNQCLTKGYEYNDFNIYAVNKEYLIGKDIKELNLFKNPNAMPSNIYIRPYGSYIHDSIPFNAIEEYYQIVGLSKTQVILHKWKEVIKFNNGKPDSTSTYTYEGDVSQLYQKIQVGINSKQNPSSIDVFPNPARKSFHLKMNNSYHGSVTIQLIKSDGKVAKSQTLTKTAQILDTDIPVENLAVGSYYVSVKFGELVKNKKIVIK